MERKLKIYTKYNKIKIRKVDLIFYFLIATLLILSNTNSIFYDYKNDSLENLTILLALIMLPYSIFFLFYNLFRYEKINGDLSKELVFENEKIIVGDEIYYLDDIAKIQIYNSDIKGQLVNTGVAILPQLSNGIKNYVELTFKDGKQMKIYFLQTENENTGMFENEFQSYCRYNRMSSEDLSNIQEINRRKDLTNKNKLILTLLTIGILVALTFYNF